MVIQNNILAMNASRMQTTVNKKVSTSTKKVSSGYKINSAADGAAELSISEKMRYQIRGLDTGADNIQEGVGYCQTADGALNEVQDMLQRMNELAIKAANGTNSESDRASIDAEMQALKTEIERVSDTTKFNEEYIFRTDAVEEAEPYELEFEGFPDNVYIYNTSYDATTHTASYGGVAYRGTRYAWNEINANMYDSTTGLFRKGTYQLKTAEGTTLTLICKDGSKPPEVSRSFSSSAGANGIYIEGELIKWDEVKTKSGRSITQEPVLNEAYTFRYHGVEISFVPEEGEDLQDVAERLCGITWRSDYQMPSEETAVSTDFSSTTVAFKSNADVAAHLNGTFQADDYLLRAGDGTNGTIDGLWLEIGGVAVSGSEKTWAELGITNWGNLSQDIWSDIVYKYTFDQFGNNDMSFEFMLINETSKDSVIDALDKVALMDNGATAVENHAQASVSGTSNLIGAQMGSSNLSFSLLEEYELGRDYSQLTDVFGSENFTYDGTKFSVTYNGKNDVDNDGNITTKTYENTQTATDAALKSILNTIKANYTSYLDVIKARYEAGATDLTEVNLFKVAALTGNGAHTYLEDTITIGSDHKVTGNLRNGSTYAAAQIDFSGLGTSYQLADLVGMGFDSTCQTCNNHYSVQFATDDLVSTNWKTANINGEDYRYSMQKSGRNYVLYVDVESMMNGNNITDGVSFTNALLDVIDQSGFDFHYTQYATDTNGSVLYVADNRTPYVENGTSIATNADFYPRSYGFNSVADFSLTFLDTSDTSQSATINYTYDYSDLYNDLIYNYEADSAGDYVYDPASGAYEKYNSSNAAHAGLDRYKLKSVELDTKGMDLDTYLTDYIKNTIFPEVAQNSVMDLISDYAGYYFEAAENENNAMVTKYTTPYQVFSTGYEEIDSFRIQCSSDVKDCILITRQGMSIQKLGLTRASTETENMSLKTIGKVSKALAKVSEMRSKFGAYQNRLEHAYENNRNVAENTQYAESVIRDTDIAEEMLAYSTNSILQQAGWSMMAQANQMNEGVLQLLQ